jgi:nucleoside-diphosphate-sugar epimerase
VALHAVPTPLGLELEDPPHAAITSVRTTRENDAERALMIEVSPAFFHTARARRELFAIEASNASPLCVILRRTLRSRPFMQRAPFDSSLVGITGATGFVGMYHLACRVRAGLPTRILVRASHPWAKSPPPHVEIVVGDLDDKAALARFAQGISACFHYAARASFRAPWEQLERINIQGTRNVAEACAKAGVKRFLNCSTVSTMIRAAHLDDVDESVLPVDANPDAYGRSKVAAEKAALAAHAGTVSVRPPWVWGPGDTNNLPTVLGPGLKGMHRVVDGGKRRGEQIHVSTFIRENEALVCTEASRGKVYFATDKIARPFGQFAQELLRAAGITTTSKNIPGWIVPVMHKLDKPVFQGKLKLSPATAVLARYEQTFSDKALRTLVGDLEVMSDDEFMAELRTWLTDMGGPKRIVRGRKQGADEELVAMIWSWLLDKSESVKRVAEGMRA